MPRKTGSFSLLPFLLFASLSSYSAPQLEHPADAQAIRDLETRWQDGWNRHDIAALADLFTDDADFVTVIGKWCKGRKEFYDYHVRLHQVMFKDSIWKTTETQIRFLSQDIAIVHVNWGITGDRDADGTPRNKPRDGILTQVIVKQDGQWRIMASQNTNIQAVPSQLK
jgi:uncharacterized protein (TIGR02246 family)